MSLVHATTIKLADEGATPLLPRTRTRATGFADTDETAHLPAAALEELAARSDPCGRAQWRADQRRIGPGTSLAPRAGRLRRASLRREQRGRGQSGCSSPFRAPRSQGTICPARVAAVRHGSTGHRAVRQPVVRRWTKGHGRGCAGDAREPASGHDELDRLVAANVANVAVLWRTTETSRKHPLKVDRRRYRRAHDPNRTAALASMRAPRRSADTRAGRTTWASVGSAKPRSRKRLRRERGPIGGSDCPESSRAGVSSAPARRPLVKGAVARRLASLVGRCSYSLRAKAAVRCPPPLCSGSDHSTGDLTHRSRCGPGRPSAGPDRLPVRP